MGTLTMYFDILKMTKHSLSTSMWRWVCGQRVVIKWKQCIQNGNIFLLSLVRAHVNERKRLNLPIIYEGSVTIETSEYTRVLSSKSSGLRDFRFWKVQYIAHRRIGAKRKLQMPIVIFRQFSLKQKERKSQKPKNILMMTHLL